MIGISIGGLYSWTNTSRINTDIHNAKAIENAISSIATSKEFITDLSSNDDGDEDWYTIEWINGEVKDADGADGILYRCLNKSVKSSSKTIGDYIIPVLNDGFPDSKTGYPFFLSICSYNGSIKVFCKNRCDESAKFPWVLFGDGDKRDGNVITEQQWKDEYINN